MPFPFVVAQRLGWDQPAASLEALRAHTFNLYVDGNVATFVDPQCTETLAPHVDTQCSGALPSMPPGRHVLTVTSVLNGAESPPSASFVVEVPSSGQVSAVGFPAKQHARPIRQQRGSVRRPSRHARNATT